ncbi:hypothetical protein [Streptosporangium amethystogenes]|uniref:hypothetical protein n=1 Tax=Streptosporangium amethystogenes TaxID=2002 RepID=UPI0012F8DBE4|nr:hypothetical protein [Streptosporangium amethystogenes]
MRQSPMMLHGERNPALRVTAAPATARDVDKAQLFALSTAITSAKGGATLDTAKPRAVLAAVIGPVLARGRLDGLYTR